MNARSAYARSSVAQIQKTTLIAQGALLPVLIETVLNVVRIFPNESLAWRLIGALAAEQHEAWLTGRRYPRRCVIATMDAYEAWRASHGSPAQHAGAT
jgi:transposase-like protein